MKGHLYILFNQENRHNNWDIPIIAPVTDIAMTASDLPQ